MGTFLSLNKITEDKISKLFNENGAFFAFGKVQFEEKKQPGVVYVTLASGLLCPKENASKVNEEIDKIYTEGLKEQVTKFGAERIIEHEYFNHETQITGDTDQVKDILSSYIEHFPELFTEELIESVFKACFQKAMQNDWF